MCTKLKGGKGCFNERVKICYDEVCKENKYKKNKKYRAVIQRLIGFTSDLHH